MLVNNKVLYYHENVVTPPTDNKSSESMSCVSFIVIPYLQSSKEYSTV
jgi:hypothetical protein